MKSAKPNSTTKSLIRRIIGGMAAHRRAVLVDEDWQAAIAERVRTDVEMCGEDVPPAEGKKRVNRRVKLQLINRTNP